MIPGVAFLLIHVLRWLLTVPRAPIAMGMTNTFLHFYFSVLVVVDFLPFVFCYPCSNNNNNYYYIHSIRLKNSVKEAQFSGSEEKLIVVRKGKHGGHGHASVEL